MLEAIEARAKPYFEGAAPAHDWRHVERVDRLATTLTTETDADETILRAAVSLHDIGREREAHGEIEDHAIWGSERAGEILTEVGLPEATIAAVTHCVRAHRYSDDVEPKTIEAKLLCDGDNLDAMGAVGIGRVFSHGGTLGYPMHDEGNGQLAHLKSEILDLRDRMYTEPGRALAADRHAVVERFVRRFEAEVAGEK